MRVLFLTHRLPYAANRGDRIRALHILRSLKPHADVDLLSLVHSKDEEARVGDLRDLVSTVTVARVPRLLTYPRAAVAMATERSLTHALLDAPGLHAASVRLANEHPPDVVFAFCSGMARFAIEAPLASFPLVLDMVDVDSEKWRALARTAPIPKRWVYAREARLLAPFEARVSRLAHTVFVVNERERRSLLDLEPTANVVALPIGVDLSEFLPPGPPAQEPRVVFCGVMNYRPNEEGMQWFAQQVWPLVLGARPDARLSIVGSEPGPSVLRLAKDDPTIEVTGAVPRVAPHLWRSAVAVAPLLIARGVQNKVLETTAAGLPSVVTPAVQAGLPAEILPACLIASDPESFAAAVLDLLGLSPAERRAMAARANVQVLSWPERLAPLVGIVRQAANSIRPASPTRVDVP